MSSSADIHTDRIVGELTAFDRMLFKGHVSKFFPEGSFAAFLSSQGVLLKDFKGYVKAATARVKAHAQQVAAAANRPYEYLAEASTKRSGLSKKDRARRIAEADGITEGLVCVFATVEPCTSFDVRGNRKTYKLEVVRRRRKCLYFYFYYIDADLGFCHLRLQSWFPFEIQVWVNGREWLARRLDKEGIGYKRYHNALTSGDDLARAQSLAEKFAHRRWPALLNALARKVNPLLDEIAGAGWGGYWWYINQAEVATDILFKSRRTLEEVWADLARHAAPTFSSWDVLAFLGRKLHPALMGSEAEHRGCG